MTRLLSNFCALACAIATSLPALSATGSDGETAGLQAALNARVAQAPGVGIAVGIVRDGKVTTYFAGGTGKPSSLDEHTLFEIGSVSKTFTATVLAEMALAKQVALDAPISRYLPRAVQVPAADNGITLLDLAEQRSGLPRMPNNMDDIAGADPYADYTTTEMYSFLSSYALTRAPGSKYEYSNYGIGLLGQVLAHRAQVPYTTLVQRRVLDPLQMTDTQFATVPPTDPARFAVGHDLGGNPLPAWHFQSLLPAGGIRSSLSDMLKFLRCNMGQGPLANACLFAQTPRAESEPNHRIGLVWENNDTSGITAHGGDTAGFHAFVAISKDRHTGVVVLSNGAVVADIAAHVLAPSYPVAACPQRAPAPADAHSPAGTYCNALGGMDFVVQSASQPDTLSIALLPQPSFSYAKTGTDEYTNAQYGATVRFLRQSDAIVGLELLQAGQRIPAFRYGSDGPLVAKLPSGVPAAVALDPAIVRQYAGTYSAGSLAFTVTDRDGKLYVQLTGQPAIEVYPSAKDEFFYKIVDAQITFLRDADGNVTGLRLHQNGQDVDAAKKTSVLH